MSIVRAVAIATECILKISKNLFAGLPAARWIYPKERRFGSCSYPQPRTPAKSIKKQLSDYALYDWQLYHLSTFDGIGRFIKIAMPTVWAILWNQMRALRNSS